MDYYYYFDLSKPITPRKAYFNVVNFLPTTWSEDACFQTIGSFTSLCMSGGLSRGGYDASPSSNWEIDNDPDLHHPGLVPDDDHGSKRRDSDADTSQQHDSASTPDPSYHHPTDTTALLSPANTKRQNINGPWSEYECFNNGYQFPLSTWTEGLNAFCNWAAGHTILQGDPHPDLKTRSGGGTGWYDIQSRCTLLVTVANCLAAMSPLVTGCATSGDTLSRAGWAADACTTWTLDNGPDLRRLGAAPNPPS
ncbi:hypothetical protein B0A55_04391 [Friedmanniomyces simplex]|uniref:Uncharacterized protein n=1 Tax=Friedmanniomyces simplex TaxID=329884 RepID=A0A4V5NH68_9PEZI|nr:hypothetical protein B0A55_04391 [Friedmanniomyces simplex]